VYYTCRGLRQNKANSRRGRAIFPRRSTLRPLAPVSRLYKQTQSAGANRATTPRCPVSFRQQTQFPGTGRTWARRSKQTQFGSRAGAWGREVLYKQTQFPAGPQRLGTRGNCAEQSQFRRVEAMEVESATDCRPHTPARMVCVPA
jgi:hypothetical protein